MSRKVVLLGPLPPPYGGVSVYMSILLEHLRSRGVRMWAYFGAPYAGDAGVRRFRHRRLGLAPLALGEGRGARVLDATHFHLEHPNKLLLPLWLALKKTLGIQWVKIILDGSLPSRRPRFGPLQSRLFEMGVGAVDEFVVVHEDLRRWLRDEAGARQPVAVIPCLLPPPPQSFDAPLDAELEGALAPFLHRPRRVCSVGAFTREYGFGDAARAVETLRRETGEEIGLALLDGTFARDEGYRAETLDGRDWITVSENVPNPQVYQIMKRSDAFVRATEREGYGISRVEALWAGLPVVATNAGETRGMLTYEFGDVDALTRQLRRALFERPAAEVEHWSAEFRREAEENLRALCVVLGI